MSEQGATGEVTRIMRQLTLEYEATQRGVLEATYGLAPETRRSTSAARLASMVDMQEELIAIVGSTEANKLLVQALNVAHIR